MTPYIEGVHLKGIIELHERESVRFTRNQAEFSVLLQLPKVAVSVAMRDSTVVGYLVNAKACNKRGFTEYGGELAAVQLLLSHVFSQEEADVTIPLLAYDPTSELAQWASRLNVAVEPLPSSKGANHEMIYPITHDRVTDTVRRRLFVWGLDHV